MPRFRQAARQLFSEGRRRPRVERLVAKTGLDPAVARSYDTAAEGNLRADYRENAPRARRTLSRMVKADEGDADSRDLFHISVDRF